MAAFCQLIAHENGHFLSVVYTMMPDRGPVNDHLTSFQFVQVSTGHSFAGQGLVTSLSCFVLEIMAQPQQLRLSNFIKNSKKCFFFNRKHIET